jgi:hypothetical protein
VAPGRPVSAGRHVRLDDEFAALEDRKRETVKKMRGDLRFAKLSLALSAIAVVVSAAVAIFK